MKRPLLMILFLLSASPSLAAMRWNYTDPVNWQRTGLAPSLNGSPVGTALTADTTQAVTTNWVLAPALNGGTAIDSTTTFALVVSTGGTSSDTIYVGTQVSMDGQNWVTVTNNQIFLAASTIPPIASAILLETGANTSNSYVRKYEVTNRPVPGDYGFAGIVSASAPNDLQLLGYRLIRWIVTWGSEGGAGAQAWCGRWEEVIQ